MLLKYGSTGDEVKRLQQALGINADGIYGNQTASAVKAYQQKNGLRVDGIAGTQTLGKLYTPVAKPITAAAAPITSVMAPAATPKAEAYTPIDYKAKAETSLTPTYTAEADAIRRKYEALMAAQKASLATLDDAYDDRIDRVNDSYDNVRDTVNNETLNRGMGRSSYVVDKLTDVGKEEASAIDDIEDQRSSEIKSINSMINSYKSQMEEALASNDLTKAQAISAEVQKLQDAALNTEIDTLDQYSNDYQAEINRRQASADTSDDALIPYLKAARQKKLQAMEEAKTKAAQQAQELAYSNALKLYTAGATLTAEQYKLLGIAPNSLSNATRKTNYTVNKPYYNPKSGTKSSGSDYTLKW